MEEFLEGFEEAKIPFEKKHASGHRERLRDKFLSGSPESFADYELLELLLFMAIPRRDVKPLAKDLIAEFGSYAAVLSADVRRLRAYKGLSDAAVAAIKSVQASAIYLARAEVADKPVVSGWQALIDYVRTGMAHQQREQFRVIFLNRKNKIITDEVLGEGTVDHAPVYPRELVKRCLELSATAIILVHNHPSGDPKPSKGDIAMTKELIKACSNLDINVHDHIVVGKYGHCSFKNMGLL